MICKSNQIMGFNMASPCFPCFDDLPIYTQFISKSLLCLIMGLANLLNWEKSWYSKDN